MERVSGHGGQHAVTAASQHGIDIMWTLSGAHVFPLYDAAVKGPRPMRLIDVRHEQTAVFAAEGLARLERVPGLAALTAGPGITNGVSAITTAHFNGTPLLVIGGRAPQARWGQGSLQELDHPPILSSVTKRSSTISRTELIYSVVDDALSLAATPHRGPVFLDIPMDQLFGHAEVDAGHIKTFGLERTPEADDLLAVSRLLAGAERPVLVLGSDVWSDQAEDAAQRLAEDLQLPVVCNGQGRGIITGPLNVTRARGVALKEADLVVVAGAPLDFRLGYGVFGSAQVVHLADSPQQLAQHAPLAASAAGDLSLVFDGISRGRRTHADWLATLVAACQQDRPELRSDSDPIHPARIYGELLPRLADDAVVIGDGGDFVSFAGKYVEPRQPGCWLDPGPYGCLGTGLGYAAAARIARPDSQVVLLLGDGAAGFSLMDADSLVRHQLPAVMICGNNSAWGLEKGPMQFLYGYDVAADLARNTRYDQVVQALGGDGELVTKPQDVGPALDRAFASPVPYLVNVVTDTAISYPRNTTGV
jgi:acetolactate synthase-1/2/3 large subunit